MIHEFVTADGWRGLGIKVIPEGEGPHVPKGPATLHDSTQINSRVELSWVELSVAGSHDSSLSSF